MARGRPRTPLGKAVATGRVVNNPGRFRDRKEPKGNSALGDAPDHLNPLECACWAAFARELPWLKESDRALAEVASMLRAHVWAGTASLSVLSALRGCLSSMGGTPADRTKVADGCGDDEYDPLFDDPAEKYIN
jgi:hypothetical protein